MTRLFPAHPILKADWMDTEQSYEQRIATAPHACPRFCQDCNSFQSSKTQAPRLTGLDEGIATRGSVALVIGRSFPGNASVNFYRDVMFHVEHPHLLPEICSCTSARCATLICGEWIWLPHGWESEGLQSSRRVMLHMIVRSTVPALIVRS